MDRQSWFFGMEASFDLAYKNKGISLGNSAAQTRDLGMSLI